MVKKKLLAGLAFIFLTIGLFATFALSANVPMMTKEELKAMLGNPDLVILDFRLGSDYFSSDSKIKGAARILGNCSGDIVGLYPKGKTFVFYCASPNEVTSAGNLKHLIEVHRTEGYTNVFVPKGGWEEWLKANYPTEKK
jgi:rhodanese-related sulfurtransferase